MSPGSHVASASASASSIRFCKVCFDAKKPEYVYTSHFVKDVPGPYGKIVCPTLLNQECQYCKNPGHTVSYCSALKKKEKMVRTMSRRVKSDINSISKPIQVENSMYYNAFAVICDDEDCDDCDECDKVEMPASNFEPCSAPQLVVSYASIAALPPPPPPQQVVPVAIPEPLITKPKTTPLYTFRPMKSWVDMDDSSDDE